MIAKSISFHKQCKTEISPIPNFTKYFKKIRNQTRAKMKKITKEQREELLEQGRKEGKGDFLQKIGGTSGTQGDSAI